MKPALYRSYCPWRKKERKNTRKLLRALGPSFSLCKPFN